MAFRGCTVKLLSQKGRWGGPAPLQRIPFPFPIFIPQLLRTASSSPMSCFLRLKRLFTLSPPPGNTASDSTPTCWLSFWTCGGKPYSVPLPSCFLGKCCEFSAFTLYNQSSISLEIADICGLNQLCIKNIFIYLFSHAQQLVGSYFPDRDWMWALRSESMES